MLRIFIIIILAALNQGALAEDNLPESLKQLNAELLAKKAELEPFDEKDIKIDLESLGLDDLSEMKPIKKKKVRKKKEKLPIFNFDDEGPTPIEVISKDSSSPIESISKDVDKTSDHKEGFINKIHNFLQRDKTIKKEDKDTKDQETKAINDVKKEGEGINKESKTLKKQQDTKKYAKINEKKRQDNLKKLQELRERYLIKIKENSTQKDSDLELFKNRDTATPTPRRKNINLFISHELPAMPILNRFRTSDNLHIPIILSPLERMGILFDAISGGNVAFFNSAYEDVKNPNVKNDLGDSILIYAILLQKHAIIASILNKGANPNLLNDLGYNPIDVAIELRDIESIELLIKNKANIHYLDAFGRTHLMHAARVGFLPAVQLFIAGGVGVNIMDDDGFTALSIAYRHKKEVIVQFLIKNGAKTWIEKPYNPKNHSIIKELENHWK